ncbi:hypothetical protein TNCV_3716731 [Trichonephila clavipes]|nr:hypothetical protein TNCV_3716731 [Trichonephila clavipes]
MSLTCLLGFTWATGFFSLSNQSFVAYLFVFLNGLQGFFLFLTQMIFNEPVRNKLFAIYKENIAKISTTVSINSFREKYLTLWFTMVVIALGQKNEDCDRIVKPECGINVGVLQYHKKYSAFGLYSLTLVEDSLNPTCFGEKKKFPSKRTNSAIWPSLSKREGSF